jgi:hypothetical protein
MASAEFAKEYKCLNGCTLTTALLRIELLLLLSVLSTAKSRLFSVVGRLIVNNYGMFQAGDERGILYECTS